MNSKITLCDSKKLLCYIVFPILWEGKQQQFTSVALRFSWIV